MKTEDINRREEDFDKTDEDIVFENHVNPFIIKTSVKPNELGGGH